MRILQVVTYISPDGAYGGPVRVAINQAKALTELGHDVIVAGSAGGFEGKMPSTYDEFPVRLFSGRQIIPGGGFAGLVSPTLLRWLPGAMRHADIVHVHMSRDLVTLPAAVMALRIGTPLVIQPHGMIDSTNKILAKPLDAWLTVPALRGASQLLHLTQKEKSDLIDVAGNDIALSPLPNGVRVPQIPAIEHLSGPANNPEIICLARVHAIKRPLAFVKAGAASANKWPETRFTLIGPDEGEGQQVRSAIRQMGDQKRVSWPGALRPDQTSDRMRQASIFVLPSESELYSMSTLEAMALGVPVVITDTCGLAPLVLEAHAGLVCDQSQSSLNESIEYLLQNPYERITMGKNGRRAIQDKFAINAVAQNLETQYRSAIATAD